MDKMPYPVLKSRGKYCMVLDPSPVKQLSPIHVCKIGLKRTRWWLMAVKTPPCMQWGEF
jgi:hypothetical protein